MSTLDRISIQGIRSFGMNAEDMGTIKFKSPLTLILGRNGCGKTTIVECLKFATSGDQPPNSRAGTGGGSGFVHDPKMLKVTEVKAQVKLRIKDVNGRDCIVCRSLSNIQKHKKVECKKIDATISVKDDISGKYESIGNRCADADLQMGILLGVSKPILNYVIFCHQEDSCWPMEEGKKVKERFDQIFDSVAYNKCLDSIRKLKKKRSTDITILKKEAESLLVYKNEAVEKDKRLFEEEARLTATDNTISDCKKELLVVDGKLDVVKEKEINIANHIAEKRVNDIKLQELKKSIKELKTGLRDREFQGSDEDLEQQITSFNADLSSRKSELEKVEKNLDDFLFCEKRLRAKLSDAQNEIGGLKRDVETNKELIQNRNESINKLASDLNLPEMESPYNESQATNVLDSVERKLRDLKSEVISLKLKNDEEEKRLQNVIDGFREEKAKLEQIKKTKTDQLNETKKEIDKVKGEITEIAHSTRNLSILDNKLKRINKDLEDHQNSVSVSDIDRDIKDLQKNRESMDEQLQEINKEMDNLIEINKIQTSLDSCVDRKVSCEDEIDRLRSKNEEYFRHLFDEVPTKNLSQHLDNCLSKLSDRIRSMQKDINDKQQQITKLESKQHYLEEKLRKANQTLSDDLEKIKKICGNDDYDMVLIRVSEDLKKKQSETGKLSASDFLYREYIKKLQQPKPCCPLCKRDFEQDNSAIQLVRELEGKLKDFPTMLSNSTREQDVLSTKLNKLQQLKPVNDRVASNQSEIPDLQKELEETKEKLKNLKQELENIENDMMYGCQSDEQLARKVQADALTIDQKQIELENLTREIEELQSKIPSAGKTLHQVKNERDELQFQLENTRKKIDSNQTKKVAYNERLNKLQNDKNDIIKEQLRVQTGKQQEQQLLNKEKELKELKNTLTKEIDSAANEGLPVQQKLDKANRNREEARKNNLEIVDKESKKLNEHEKRRDDIFKLQRKIEEFERRQISSKLEKTEKSISEMKRDINGIEKKRSTLQAEKDTINADMANQDARQRDLLDNRKLRAKRIEENSLDEKIKEMDERIGVLDYNVIKEEKQKLQEQINSLMTKKNHAEGRRKELQIAISNIRMEINKPIYKNAVKNYRDKIIDLTLEEAANKDLDSYYIALDWALQHFHQERMKEINSIIKELWHKIYRGNDIDHIEIKCKIEATSSADKKRVFDYKVVQVKNDTELDMRGRCSAGQKMLASIIIRMALAETFSSNCGIMTLDEPTTNLDRENIESFSWALTEIIQNQTRKKFQLVIITHDEEFLMRLTSIDKVDQYWNVYKDDRGLSRIECRQVE